MPKKGWPQPCLDFYFFFSRNLLTSIVPTVFSSALNVLKLFPNKTERAHSSKRAEKKCGGKINDYIG